MAVITNRAQPRIEFLQVRDNGRKHTRNAQLIYSTGQSNAPEYVLRIGNHYNYPASEPYPEESGRITFSITETNWTTTRIQAKEVYNANPNGLTMDTTLDGAYANLNGFSVESIPAGGYRDVKVKIVGVGLTFDDLLLLIAWKCPS